MLLNSSELYLIYQIVKCSLIWDCPPPSIDVKEQMSSKFTKFFTTKSTIESFLPYQNILQFALIFVKLFKHRSRIQVRANYFSNRVIDDWNSYSIVQAPSLNCFKSRLKNGGIITLVNLTPLVMFPAKLPEEIFKCVRKRPQCLITRLQQ